ncbi:MAG: hypothetical protein AAF763_19710, partial [Pseudomonadota bacterium]
MADPARHPDAPEHLPGFLPAADGSDPTLTNVMIFAVVALILIGVGYLKLHALPERMAHRRSSVQLQLVAVLSLIALFTHEHIWWIAALLLVVAEPPDFLTPIRSIAASLERRSAAPAPPAEPAPDQTRAPAPAAGPGPAAGRHSHVVHERNLE